MAQTMIESKDILDLCDRFQSSLVPLDMHVLRQRDNGLICQSTDAVGREMHISDETVRTIEHRALDALAHGLDLEAAGQAITRDAPGQVLPAAHGSPNVRRQRPDRDGRRLDRPPRRATDRGHTCAS
jgi:hypothetical protein